MAIFLGGASQTVTVSGTVQVALNATRGSYTDRSGTITLGGTSQQLVAANATRNVLIVHNPSSGNLGIRFGAAAAAIGGAGTITIPPNATMIWDLDGEVPTQAVQIVGGTTGQVFTSLEI